MAQGYFDSYRGFRDPIHGFIKVYDAERDIINTPAFQRLRRIKQLGLTCLVYHGADHTRFAHSLGVMELATRVFDITTLKDKTGDRILKWKKDDRERNKVLLRLVALLHDIGHAPFSHASEELFPKGLNHEHFSAKIVAENSELKSIINGLQDKFNVNVTTEDIRNFLVGEKPEPFLQQIISGPLDADKMDYLWRDSYYAGVHYGRFDIDRLINTFVVVYDRIRKSPALGIEIGGLYAAEALMLARYYMFLQVYFHEVRRAYDLHLTDFLKTLLPNGKFPLKVKDYLTYDDYFLLYKLKEAIAQRRKNRKLAERIALRKHFKTIKEHPKVRPTQKQMKLFEDNYNELKDKFDEIRLDRAKDAPNKFETELFYLRNKRFYSPKDKYIEIDGASDIANQLEMVTMYRLYAPQDKKLPKIQDQVRKMRWEP